MIKGGYFVDGIHLCNNFDSPSAFELFSSNSLLAHHLSLRAIRAAATLINFLLIREINESTGFTSLKGRTCGIY